MMRAKAREMRTFLVLLFLLPGTLTLALASSGANETEDAKGHFRLGTQLVYGIQYSNASVADFTSMAGPTKETTPRSEVAARSNPQAFKTSIKGSLLVRALRAARNETLLACSLRDLQLDIRFNEVEASADAQRIQTALSNDFYAVVNAAGAVVRIEFAPEVDATSQGFVRAVLAGLQIVRPSGTLDPSFWESEEQDANGKFIARYEPNGSGDGEIAPRAFTKKKLRYLPRSSSPGDRVTTVPLTIIPDGETRLRQDPATGHLLSVHAREHQVISLSGRTLADSNSELTMTLTSSSALSDSDTEQLTRQRERLSSTLVATSLSQTKPDKAAEDRRRQETLRGATAESLLEDLTAMETGTSSDQTKTEVAERLESLFLLRPESCRLFQDTLNTSLPGGTSFRLLVTVLTRAGHAEAQAALRQAVRARQNEKPAVLLLVHALSSVAAPASTTEATMRELAFDRGESQIARSAQLALGTLANHLATDEPERAAAIVREIAEHIESSPAIETKARLLGALGNARTAEAREIVQHYLDDPDAALREAALPVILRLQPDRAEEVLSKHLLGDASENVRLASARELASRAATPVTFAAQKKVFLSDAALSVRIMLLGALWQARAAFPEAAILVRNAAKLDVSLEIRKMAETLMAKSAPST